MQSPGQLMPGPVTVPVPAPASVTVSANVGAGGLKVAVTLRGRVHREVAGGARAVSAEAREAWTSPSAVAVRVTGVPAG